MVLPENYDGGFVGRQESRASPSRALFHKRTRTVSKRLKDDFDVTFAASNRTSSARVASVTVKHIGPFFDQMRSFRDSLFLMSHRCGRKLRRFHFFLVLSVIIVIIIQLI
jgi:hypothetical protein